MKGAGHELKGTRVFLSCGVAGLHVPIAALIDYRGYRLTASRYL